jgi:hypothetical protein
LCTAHDEAVERFQVVFKWALYLGLLLVIIKYMHARGNNLVIVAIPESDQYVVPDDYPASGAGYSRVLWNFHKSLLSARRRRQSAMAAGHNTDDHMEFYRCQSL